MEYKRIIAIVPTEGLDRAQTQLQHLHVEGMTVSRVKGYGHYKNLFTSDWMTERAKLEIFAPAEMVDRVLNELATGVGGIAAVLPVERFVHELFANEFHDALRLLRYWRRCHREGQIGPLVPSQELLEAGSEAVLEVSAQVLEYRRLGYFAETKIGTDDI